MQGLFLFTKMQYKNSFAMKWDYDGKCSLKLYYSYLETRVSV